MPNDSRRRFLRHSALGAAALLTSSYSINCFSQGEQEEKLGVALVGLGNYATNQLAPALTQTRYCYLAGVVTGTPAKAEEWRKKYDLPKKNIYNYENFDRIADNPDIDIVYVVLPNAMHGEFTIRAAEAGKHVICEKPMEVSSEKCRAMIEACERNNRLLQIGYRCRYDPYHQNLMLLGRNKRLGAVKVIRSAFAFYGVNGDNWRFTDKSLSGGGPLMDIGIYCLDAARYTLGEDPVAITAQSVKTFPDKLPGMEETLTWQMEFPGGALADCMTSYVARDDTFRVYAEQGNFGLEHPAFSYGEPNGFVKGESMKFNHHNQQAVQMDAFARNILDNTPLVASGEEGLKDMIIIEAIYKAMGSGDRVALKW